MSEKELNIINQIRTELINLGVRPSFHQLQGSHAIFEIVLNVTGRLNEVKEFEKFIDDYKFISVNIYDYDDGDFNIEYEYLVLIVTENETVESVVVESVSTVLDDQCKVVYDDREKVKELKEYKTMNGAVKYIERMLSDNRYINIHDMYNLD